MKVYHLESISQQDFENSSASMNDLISHPLLGDS